MRLTPVTLLAGPHGSAAQWLPHWQQHPGFAGIAVVRDAGAAAGAGECACCALSDALTRELRGLHAARVAGAAEFDRVVVDATGVDPRPAIAALARVPLTSVRFGLSAVLATSAADALAVALADRVIAERDGLDAIREVGLYAGGALDATRWLASGPPGRAVVERMEPCRWEDVESALQAAQLQAGTGLQRLKGLVAVVGEPGPRLIQLFGHTRYPSARLADWPAGPRHTRFAIAADALETAAIARILQQIPCPPP